MKTSQGAVVERKIEENALRGSVGQQFSPPFFNFLKSKEESRFCLLKTTRDSSWKMGFQLSPWVIGKFHKICFQQIK